MGRVINNYFKIHSASESTHGIFSFVDGDTASTRRAWEDTVAARAAIRGKGAICAWRKPQAKGPWDGVALVGEAGGFLS